MVKKGFLKRIVVKQPNLSASDVKLTSRDDFLVLNREKVFLGRSKECDLVLKPKIISRKHVVFHFTNGQWSIECLNDKNGVFINGKLLKLNQVKKLEENTIISLGPNFATDFIYQFTTKENGRHSKSDSLLSPLDLSSSNGKLNRSESFFEHKTPAINWLQQPQLQIAPAQLETIKMSEVAVRSNTSEDQLRLNNKKIKQLKARVKHLEDKLTGFKLKRKDSRVKIKRISSKLKMLQNSNIKQKTLLRNAKLNLNRERTKKKELLKKIADQERVRPSSSTVSGESVSSTSPTVKEENSSKIVQKYNELFSDDLICGVCLELYLEPVSATCGHSFCKFCLMEWLKRNLTRRFDCPLCRSCCKGYFKNVVIENIIEKYLTTADEEVLATRARLVKEREKVIEASKSDPNNDNNNRRVSRYNLNNLIENPFALEMLNDSFNNFLSHEDFQSDDGSSNGEFEEEYFHETDEEFSEEDQDDFEQYDIVLED